MTPRQVTVMMLITMYTTWYNDTQTDDSDDVDHYVHRV